MGVSNVSSQPPALRCKKTVCRAKHSRQAKPNLRKRQVQFGDDEIIEFAPATPPHERASLWWTKDERKDILSTNKRLARDYRVHHRENVDRAIDVFDQCFDDDSSDSSSDESNDWLGMKVELPTHVRGLEWAVMPKSKVHRRVHVQDVLKAQEEEMPSHEVARFAVESSRPCVTFARILGQSDAMSAKPSVMRIRRPRMLPSWWK